MNTKQSPTNKPTSNTEELSKRFNQYHFEVGKSKSEEMRCNLSDDQIVAFLKRELTTVIETTRKETAQEILGMIEEKPGEPAWSRKFNFRLLDSIKDKYLTGGGGK